MTDARLNELIKWCGNKPPLPQHLADELAALLRELRRRRAAASTDAASDDTPRTFKP